MGEYTKTGKCIWCNKEKPEVTFNNKPHILPYSLGGNEIGFDICDDCNHYFGTAERGKPNIDLVYKEIFNAYRFFSQNLNQDSYKNFHSIFFNYYHKKGIIKIKNNFNSTIITRQFKRSLYNIFLQKYHKVTENGNHKMFDMVRQFARYDFGNPKVFYAFNNIIFTTADKENPKLIITDKTVEDMMMHGIFSFWFMGHQFYLEIFPTAFNCNGIKFLQKEAQETLIPAKGNEMILKLKDIMDIDFLMQRFNKQI